MGNTFFPQTIRPSVIFRDGPLTAEDYDEAIRDLQDAKTQLEANADHCHVCGDSGCWAGNCHHNPLVAARKWAKAIGVWKCWHCGYVATTNAEAVTHFGQSDDEFAMCLIQRAQMHEKAAEDARAVEAFCGGVEVREVFKSGRSSVVVHDSLDIGPDIGPDSP